MRARNSCFRSAAAAAAIAAGARADDPSPQTSIGGGSAGDKSTTVASPAFAQGVGVAYLAPAATPENYAQDYAYGADPQTPNVMLGRDNGNPALIVANRARGSTGANAPAGIMAFGFDDTPAAANTWAIYDEVRRYPGVATAAVVNEADATDFSGKAGPIDPYALAYSLGNLVAGFYIQSGGGCTQVAKCYNPNSRRLDLASTPASVALDISNNGSTFYSGINFSDTALQGNDGRSIGGYAAAVRVPRGDAIEQDFCTDTSNYPAKCGPLALGSYFLFEVDSPADVIKAHFSDSGFLLTNMANQILFQVSNLDTSHNDGLAVDAGSTSSPAVAVQAQGTDSDVSLVFRAQGDAPVTVGSGFMRIAHTKVAC